MEGKHIEVNTKLGRLRGCTSQSVLTGNTYCAFLGIPYAKPPIGDLRFKAPEPFGGWEGVREALEDGHDSKQPALVPIPGMDPNKPIGDEDCLVLNVYINELPKEGVPKKPVMFSIHGGGFLGGSGSFKANGPDYLLSGDVVFVTINYRCGAFGFLCLETEEVPGNAGLKDQTLALKWVRDNIDSFGGDPDKVTIFGISAGGSSVNYHLFSPSSRGLFHRAILQSGFASDKWKMQQNPRSLAKSLAKKLGCLSEDINAIYQCLKSASADEIVLATKEITKDLGFVKNSGFCFTPCVEVLGVNPFLTEDPKLLMKRADFCKVPTILGCAQKDGSVAALMNGVNDNEFEHLNKNPKIIVPEFLELNIGSDEEKEASTAIWDFYMKGASISWDNVNDYLAFISDKRFNLGMEATRAGLLRHSTSPVYTYLFTNHTRCLCQRLKSLMPPNFAKTMTEETCHVADLGFLYANHTTPSRELSPEDQKAIWKHVKAWTSFAKTGDPNCQELGVTWQKDSVDKPCFMDIGTSWTLREGVPFADRLRFWKELTSKYCSS